MTDENSPLDDNASDYADEQRHQEQVDNEIPDTEPEPEFDANSNAVAASLPPSAFRSLATISEEAVAAFLDDSNLEVLRRKPPRRVADELMSIINAEIAAQNKQVKGYKDPETKEFVQPTLAGPTIPLLQQLAFPDIAKLIAALYDVVKIAPSSKNSDPDLNQLAAYDDDPESEHFGTYRSSVTHIRSVVRRYAPTLPTKGFAEVVAALEDSVPVVTRGENPDLLAVRNGIIDYNAGDPQFMPFSPEHIFVAKLEVDWNPDAENVILHNDEDGTDWDVESWMRSLMMTNPAEPDSEANAGEREVVELLWEIIGATVRPYVSWNKCAFFYADKGNNGKGTLLSLMRNLLGVSNYASIPLADFGKDFLLEPLTRASAILVDENDVGAFVERGANFKAIVTNDVITINRKYKAPIAHQHFGFMVQCLNDRPQLKDKSESIYRRQAFVPFTKSFTGVERKYIKDDYLRRPEVLEYVLKRVLTMSYYSLSKPQAIVDALEDFKIENDPVYAFWDHFADEFTWDLLPFTYLYDLYKAWFAANYPTGKPLGSIKFVNGLLGVIDKDPEWECPDRRGRHRPGSMMSVPQTLTAEYDLVGWINHAADKRNPVARSTMSPDMFKQNYSGLRRVGIEESDPTEGFDLTAAGVPPEPQTQDDQTDIEQDQSTPTTEDTSVTVTKNREQSDPETEHAIEASESDKASESRPGKAGPGRSARSSRSSDDTDQPPTATKGSDAQ